MSDNPQLPKQEPQQPPSPLLKAYLKKPRRESNQKKKGVPKELQQASILAKQNTSTKRPKQKQLQLHQFMASKASSNAVQTTSSEEYLNSDRASLEQELKKKDETIKNLQMEHRNEQQKSARLKEQHLSFCQKTRQAILRSKIELAVIRRRQKGEINNRFGYFRDSSCKQFLQGDYVSQFKEKINNIQKTITEFQSKKAQSSPECKAIIISQLQFMKKQLFQCKQQLQIREKEVNNYKQQLRLYFKGQDCIFAKDNWPLLKNRYQPLSFIGNGGFGEVYSGFDAETYQDIAIKIHDLDKTSAQIYQPLMKHLNRQIKIHKQLKHPNIVRMIDQLQLQGNRIGIVMEYCSGPELRSYLKKQVCLDERQAKQIIKQVIFAVKYLHDQKYAVIHYDLKPANILFHNGIIKIVDFGISKVIEGEDSRIDLTSPKAGTFYYLPPEVYQEYDAKISSKVDVWSIGVIFYEMLYGRRPFGHGVSQDKLIHSREILKGNQIDFPNNSPKNYRISNEAKDFIRKCLERNPQNRLSSQDAYDHDYIN